MKKKNKFLKQKKDNEIPTNDIKISVERTYSVPSIEINGQKIVGIFVRGISMSALVLCCLALT